MACYRLQVPSPYLSLKIIAQIQFDSDQGRSMDVGLSFIQTGLRGRSKGSTRKTGRLENGDGIASMG